MHINFKVASNEISITWVQELSSMIVLMPSSEAEYHYQPMFWYQQPEMRVEILQRDAEKQSLWRRNPKDPGVRSMEEARFESSPDLSKILLICAWKRVVDVSVSSRQ
jgi:hypothetical protein